MRDEPKAPGSGAKDSQFWHGGEIRFEVDGVKQKATNSWYRGENCNFNPDVDTLEGPDSVVRNVVGAWAPQTPLIGPDTKVCAFGSCFAEHISNWLAQRNFSILTKEGGDSESTYVVRFGEGLVNSYALLQQFEWAFENKKVEVPLWHGYKAETFGYDDRIRQSTLAMFERTDVFILTLGLSEVWYDTETGGVFWRAVPQRVFDPNRHKFRVTTVAENKENLFKIYRLIRKYRPQAKIIFTMSPIPLVATFRPVPCITANSASKAILRAALDEFLRDVVDEGFAHYWPSYEIVLDVFYQRWARDRRHVRKEILDFVMTAFESVWCHGREPQTTLTEAWLKAKSVDGSLPSTLPMHLETDNVEQVSKVLAAYRRRKEVGKVATIMRRIEELAMSCPNLAAMARNLESASAA